MVNEGVLHTKKVSLAALNLSCRHLQALSIRNPHANAGLDTMRDHLTQETQGLPLPNRATHVVVDAVEEQAGKTLEPLDTHAVSRTSHLAYPLVHRRLSTQSLKAHKDFLARRIVELPPTYKLQDTRAKTFSWLSSRSTPEVDRRVSLSLPQSESLYTCRSRLLPEYLMHTAGCCDR